MSGWISLADKKNKNNKRKAQRGQHNVRHNGKKLKTPKILSSEKQRIHTGRWKFVESNPGLIGEPIDGSKDGPFIKNQKINSTNDANDAYNSDDSIGSVIDADPEEEVARDSESYSDRTHVTSSASHQRSVNPGSISLPLTPPSTVQTLAANTLTSIEGQPQRDASSDSSLDLRISDSEADNEDSQLLLEDSNQYDSEATVPPDSQDF